MNPTKTSPWVVVSPLVPARGTTPLSTLMPTTMPLSLRYWVKGLPLSVFWYIVSWKRMTPPMQGTTRSSAVKRSWRYSLLFSSVFSALMLWKRLATLPRDCGDKMGKKWIYLWSALIYSCIYKNIFFQPFLDKCWIS